MSRNLNLLIDNVIFTVRKLQVMQPQVYRNAKNCIGNVCVHCTRQQMENVWYCQNVMTQDLHIY